LAIFLCPLFILAITIHLDPLFWPQIGHGESILDQKGVADCLLREFLVRGAVAWALTVVVIVLLFVPLKPHWHCGCHQWNVARKRGLPFAGRCIQSNSIVFGSRAPQKAQPEIAK